MVNGSQISLSPPAELDLEINRAVESGEYATGSEVVLEALAEWAVRRTAAKDMRAKPKPAAAI